MNRAKEFKKELKRLKDPYKILSENALERFTFFLIDTAKIDLPNNQELIRDGILTYLRICKKESLSYDKTVTSNLIKAITNFFSSTMNYDIKLCCKALSEVILRAIFEVEII